MSEAGTTNPNAAAEQGAAQNRVTELKVSGHLMTLDTGVFAVFQVPGSPPPGASTGLPGVRISLPPGAAERPDDLCISTFLNDGWISGHDGAALVRVGKGPAQVLVTVYQAPTASPDSAPRLQVMRLGAEQAGEARPAAAQAAVPILSADAADVVVHVQGVGDQAAGINEWAGAKGSRRWIEGFSLTPHQDLDPADIEYQAVLGRGWLSPWIEGGKFCGSRGMALPLLGLKVRLKGAAAKNYDCKYSASFVDGSAVGPMSGGETCEAESLAALEAFQISIQQRGGAAAGAAPKTPAAAAPKAPAARSTRSGAPKPAAKRAAAKRASR
ncbi:MAG TPA: hypothetical protein VKT26_03545 [Acetobacteraceae bacterium]|nr:hypothetical protein [Acetobacteraceae bacterium]